MKFIKNKGVSILSCLC